MWDNLTETQKDTFFTCLYLATTTYFMGMVQNTLGWGAALLLFVLFSVLPIGDEYGFKEN